MDNYQNEAEHRSDIVEEEFPHPWGVHSALSRTESVAADRSYENDEPEYEYIKFADMQMRRIPETGVNIQPALFGSKVDKWKSVSRKSLIIIAVMLFISLVMAIAGLVVACLKCFPECSDGWQTFQEKCYYISSTAQKWNVARSTCQYLSGDLVVIDNELEWEFLIHKMNFKSNVWLGLIYTQPEKEWRWLDGTNLSYTYWEEEKDGPVKYTEGAYRSDCAVIKQDVSKWKIVDCRKRHEAICERDRPVVCVLQSPFSAQ
ncbi:C-type lectin lectoxin-Phi1-like [Hemicordylus capensis]|uniref:C-type lectin lectoxin-Phi1-like n=1 Tax=Hemicordylus capensis TaxID=884348 RepID=UPI0023034196|nr:C-type lectin lectoxin-Phi1-like [Hemicordylus capensis]